MSRESFSSLAVSTGRDVSIISSVQRNRAAHPDPLPISPSLGMTDPQNEGYNGIHETFGSQWDWSLETGGHGAASRQVRDLAGAVKRKPKKCVI